MCLPSDAGCGFVEWTRDLFGAEVVKPMRNALGVGVFIGGALDVLFRGERQRRRDAEEAARVANERADKAEERADRAWERMGRVVERMDREQERAEARHQELMGALGALAEQIAELAKYTRRGSRRRGRRP